eukprot:TRINITY_DN26638_c0_g2_i1.p1 TRINITY_DN26638_c0_g2~~TRINITY_DN26638_c0_g2_i1.p1  ORF type:complete len:347 (-),score=41.65 TRINITY_DN26638_c0_g2_i1:82-1029(-)
MNVASFKSNIRAIQFAPIQQICRPRYKFTGKCHQLQRRSQQFSFLNDNLYQLTNSVNDLVSSELVEASPLTFITLFFAGLITSFSPCTLSVLPLTIGYITGFADNTNENNTINQTQTNEQTEKEQKIETQNIEKSKNNVLVQRAFYFYLGLATTLTLLGIVSVSLGRAYGQIGVGLPILVSIFAIVMGLDLLQVITLQFPSLNIDLDDKFVFKNGNFRAYVVGGTFALAASPCSTPVLATVLAYCAGRSQGDIGRGGLLLFFYSTGYVFPLLVAASFAGTAGQMLKLRQYSGWISPVSGVLLVAGGSYSLLSRVI